MRGHDNICLDYKGYANSHVMWNPPHQLSVVFVDVGEMIKS